METRFSYSLVYKVVSVFVALALLLANVPVSEPLNAQPRFAGRRLSDAETADLGALSDPSSSAAAPPALSPSASAPAEPAAQAHIEQTFGQLPLYFVENQGQLDKRVAYYIQGSDKTIYFTSEGVTFALTERRTTDDEGPMTASRGERRTTKSAIRNPQSAIHNPKSEIKRWAVKLDFVGANPNVRPIGQDKTEAVLSYFKGKPDQWHTSLPTYARIIYPDLWSGIDLVYYGTVSQLKYEFVVHPGADPTQIRLAYRGATGTTLNAAGQLEVTTPLGGFHDDTPVAYQEMDGQRVAVPVAYALNQGDTVNGFPEQIERISTHSAPDLNPFNPLSKSADSNPFNPKSEIRNPKSYAFRVGNYDLAYHLILDPAVLVYAGYIGGNDSEYGRGIAVDGAGNAYVTGMTSSAEDTFPVTGGPDLTYNGGWDVFVAKVNPAGTGLIYAGYIGGYGSDVGYGIAVDGAGNAYVTGFTDSTEDTFPVTGGPDLTYNGERDVFVAKVNPTGTELVYAGYIGGNDSDASYDIAVDGAGNAYVTGMTSSAEDTFPVTGGPDLTFNGDYNDAFVAKVNPVGTALVYAGYIGGDNRDKGYGIAVDGAGNAYVTGFTDSTEATFPVTGGPDLTYNGGWDVFVAKVNPAGTALVYTGYIGGNDSDASYGIAVDGAGNAYITGGTHSTEATFPVTVGPGLTFIGGTCGIFTCRDAFVAKVNPAGTELVYAGYIGGNGSEVGYGIAVDSAGNAYVAGWTSSAEDTFPVIGGPDLTYNGVSDVFVAKVNPAGTSLIYAGYIGGDNMDGEELSVGIAVDSAGNAYVTGYTMSTEDTFPVTVGPDLTFNGDYDDAFVAKVNANGGPFSISGRIRDDSGNPIAGVIVSTDSGISAITNASGIYTIIHLATGTHTLIPTLSGYIFAPVTRTVTVPPNATGQDFIKRPIPTRFLDLPVDYSDTTFARAAMGNVGENPGRVNSWFDHTFPDDSNNNNLTRWNGPYVGTKSVNLYYCTLGESCYDGHNGIDFQRRIVDEPILAAASGVITNIVRSTTGYGYRVWIDHLNGYATLYAHLKAKSISVTEGATIDASQQLGIMGNTGVSIGSSGIHLHLGLYYDQNGDRQWGEEEVVDPYGWQPLTEPGRADPWGVPSYYLWSHPLDSQTPADSSGGSITSQSGNKTCTIPPGTLATTVTLELWDTPPVAGASAQLRSIGHSFWLRVLEWLSGSDGLLAAAPSGFAQPITMTVTYSDTDLLHLDENQLAAYQWNESTAIWTPLTTTVDITQNQVVAQTTETGHFDLQAPLLCPADAQEPNDNYYAASLITPDGAPQSQLFDISQDEDWFKLVATAGEKYIIQTISLVMGVDTLLEIYDLDGSTLLASDDNSGEGAASRLGWQAPQSGTYFIRVAQVTGSAHGCDAVYGLSVAQAQQPWDGIVTKTVTPTGQVNYGGELTYTLLISAAPSAQVGLYDPLTDTTFLRFAGPIEGITHTNRAITGTLTVTPSNQITVSFVVQVGVPGTLGWTITVTNRACVYPAGGALDDCSWSNEVMNPAFRPYSVSIEKSVTPQGQVAYGDELTYTLVISTMPGTQVGLYDPLTDTTFLRFVEQPTTGMIAHADGVVTGTLQVTPTNLVTISFAVQVNVPITPGLTVSVTNRACVYLADETLDECIWSKEAANPVFRPYDRPYNIYLPLVLRNS